MIDCQYERPYLSNCGARCVQLQRRGPMHLEAMLGDLSAHILAKEANVVDRGARGLNGLEMLHTIRSSVQLGAQLMTCARLSAIIRHVSELQPTASSTAAERYLRDWQLASLLADPKLLQRRLLCRTPTFAHQILSNDRHIPHAPDALRRCSVATRFIQTSNRGFERQRSRKVDGTCT
jgi:hypothetical protein